MIRLATKYCTHMYYVAYSEDGLIHILHYSAERHDILYAYVYNYSLGQLIQDIKNTLYLTNIIQYLMLDKILVKLAYVARMNVNSLCYGINTGVKAIILKPQS